MSELLNSGGRVSSLFLEIAIHNDTIYKVKMWKNTISRLKEELELAELEKESKANRVDRIEMCKKILKRLKPNYEEKI